LSDACWVICWGLLIGKSVTLQGTAQGPPLGVATMAGMQALHALGLAIILLMIRHDSHRLQLLTYHCSSRIVMHARGGASPASGGAAACARAQGAQCPRPRRPLVPRHHPGLAACLAKAPRCCRRRCHHAPCWRQGPHRPPAVLSTWQRDPAVACASVQLSACSGCSGMRKDHALSTAGLPTSGCAAAASGRPDISVAVAGERRPTALQVAAGPCRMATCISPWSACTKRCVVPRV